MKDEYDFTLAEQGKFYRPVESLDIPIYLDQDVKEQLLAKLKTKPGSVSLSQLINGLLKKDLEISNQLSGT